MMPFLLESKVKTDRYNLIQTIAMKSKRMIKSSILLKITILTVLIIDTLAINCLWLRLAREIERKLLPE